MENNNDLLRPINSDRNNQPLLFTDLPEDWREHWFGMPDFSMADARPEYKITINFLTAEDVKEFAANTGINVTTSSDSGWYPNQPKLTPGKYYYDGPKTDSKYPVCIPSKGRAALQTTGRLLDELGVSHYFFVEDTEYDDYRRAIGESRVIKLPFNNLGQGSIPARNFIWDWAEKNNYSRHWVMDDNITTFTRTHNNRRLRVRGGGFFNAIETFVDRYQNIALAGPHDQGFVPDREPDVEPFFFNSRVYSCTLIDTSLPYRWRGRYNEDTDLCLRVLKDGYCTLLFRALCMNKAATAFSKGKAMSGGNTDNVYNTGDFRLKFAESLRDQHPDVVDIVWRFNRWHHQVNYSPFKKNKPIFKDGITKHKLTDNFGMRLVADSEKTKPPPVIAKSVVEDFIMLAESIKNSNPVFYRYCLEIAEALSVKQTNGGLM